MFRIAKGILKLFSVRITKKSSAALGRRTRKSPSTCNNKSHIHKKDDLDGRLFCYGQVPVVAKRTPFTFQLLRIVPFLLSSCAESSPNIKNYYRWKLKYFEVGLIGLTLVFSTVRISNFRLNSVE